MGEMKRFPILKYKANNMEGKIHVVLTTGVGAFINFLKINEKQAKSYQ